MVDNYPLGAVNDPRAPWNEKEPQMVSCAACNGKGFHWFAYSIEKGENVETTETAYNMLPENEEEAERIGYRFCKGEKETCEVCNGDGEIEYEPDYDNYE